MPNKIYINPETTLVFADSAQGGDSIITLSALPANSGRISNQYDLGTGAHASEYEWRATFQINRSTAVRGETVDLYMATSDGTNIDTELGTGDAQFAGTERLANAHYIGSVVMDTLTANTDLTKSGFTRINARYLSLIVHNNTANALTTSTSVHTIRMTPIPQEAQ